MKFALQTILFGSKIDDLDGVLDIVAGCGFSGVEFSQAPQRLWRSGASRPVTCEELSKMLGERGLALLGLSGGSLENRMIFCGHDPDSTQQESTADEVRPNYLYVEDCTERDLLRCARGRFRLALHPHVFMRNHFLEDAKLLLAALDCPESVAAVLSPSDLKEYGRLYWMPDTAHLFVEGNGLDTALGIVPIDRIAAVHLKDWDSAYGRSYHRYAKGFTELGNGDVDPKQALETLKSVNYGGWVVIEQDYAKTDPKTAAFKNATYLRDEAGIALQLDETMLRRAPDLKSARSLGNGAAHESAVNAEAFIGKLLDNVGEDLGTCYKAVADAACMYTRSHAAAVWSYSPARDDMNLLALSCGDGEPPLGALDGFPSRMSKHDLIGGKLDDPSIRSLDVDIHVRSTPTPGAAKLAEAMGALSASEMTIVPVLNRFNNHHIRFVVTVFGNRANPTDTSSTEVVDRLEWLASDMARMVDASLDDYCSYAAGRVNTLALKHDNLNSFLAALVLDITSLVGCEGLTIFLVNAKEQLEVGHSTGIKWNTPEHENYYTKDSNTLTGRVWLRNEPIVVPDIYAEESAAHWSEESGGGVNERNASALLVPLVNTWGHVIGVIRCRNKTRHRRTAQEKRSGIADTGQPGHTQAFTEDDAAVVDTIGHAAAAHLQLLMDNIRRANAVARLTHELSMPLGTVRGAITTMLGDLERYRAGLPAEIFRYDYPGDIRSWTDLMLGLLGNFEMYGRQEDFRLEPERTYLAADVVAPAVRQVEALVRRRGFDPASIRYSNFSEVPQLFVDRNRLQQLLFNLLSNSIKYALPARESFRVLIDGRRTRDYYVMTFRDWGPGIEESARTRIFEEGWRGPEYQIRAVRGQGLGLWFVRRIAEAHGGRAEVTSVYQPMEISVFLPARLASAPPQDTI